MKWLLDIADQILARKEEKVVLSTGKTPSGPIHIGSQRELFICDSLKRILTRKGVETQLIFIVDSFDPLKSIPAGLEVSADFSDNIGRPMCDVPDPYGCHRSYAEHFAQEFIEKQVKFGVEMDVIYSHELYSREEMKEAIRTALRKLDILKEIRRKFIAPTLDKEHLAKFEQEEIFWTPAMVVCPKCGMLAPKVKGEVKPNRVLSYEDSRDLVRYKCNYCGYEGEETVEKGRIKLSWRVDWAAKWSIFKVTCEPAGKDHCVKGGAYDMALEVSEKIFGYKGPIKVAYEWLTLGEHAMKTHKGIVFTPAEWLSVAPPEALRMFMLSFDPMRHISFVPSRIPEIVDEFDHLERFYYGLERREDFSESEEEVKMLYEMSLSTSYVRDKPLVRLPYKFAIYLIQLEDMLGMDKILEKSIKAATKLYPGVRVDKADIEDMKSRLIQAKNWVLKYAPSEFKFNISAKLSEDIKSRLSEKQRIFLLRLLEILAKEEEVDERGLQNKVFELARELSLNPPDAFKATYLVILGAEKGPRLAPLLLALDRSWLINRLKEAAS
ncbi:MAG: lysine--tRNA ligase [Candidatus Methanomethylicota archaeon]|uniref:Lysine--tRNA ligase n=1 Tax=Thermoproteota archaeon TaxID=2056631 RepID=A0A497EUG4_9CREN|nr:MAG: lysine--tRNA ligase [Candidatus Verstraetearchaeota archaeon]